MKSKHASLGEMLLHIFAQEFGEAISMNGEAVPQVRAENFIAVSPKRYGVMLQYRVYNGLATFVLWIALAIENSCSRN